MLHNFPTLKEAKKNGTFIAPENHTIISNYLAALSKKFKNKFHDLRNIRDCLLLIENPWHLQISVLTKLAAFRYDFAKLFDKFIELKNILTMRLLLKKREVNGYAKC